MKKIVTLVVLTFGLVFGSNVAQAQTKIAHINSQKLLELMPEMKDIQTKLQNLQKQYEQQLLTMQQEIEAKTAKLQSDTSSPDAVLEIMQAELEDLYARYQRLQQSASQDINRKQEELVTPLMKKVKDAIEKVAKAKGFEYVLDSTQGGGVIFGDPKYDLMEDVKKELNLTGAPANGQ